jgi:hypothetical protein
VRRSRAPAMFALTHPNRHVTQNPNPRQQATATGRRYHITRHTTHKTTTHKTTHTKPRHTKPRQTKPQQPPPLVPGHSTRHNCPHGPRHAASPDAAVFSMFLGAARSHQCPLHQPGPLHAGQVTTTPHTHAPTRPTPCNCQRCPTPILVPCRRDSRPTTQGNDTAPPRCPHPRTRWQNHRTQSHPRTHTAHYPRCPHTASNLLAMLARR